MPSNIKTKTARDKLAPRPNAYYETLSKGRALGFRRGPDTWFARLYAPKGVTDDKKTPFEYEQLGQHEDYSSAKAAAEQWFLAMGKGARRAPTRGTVREALDAYVADLRRHGRDDTAVGSEGRFKLVVDGTPLATTRLGSATRDDFETWRDGLHQGRKARTINRHIRSVVAGLNKAVEDLGHIGNPTAWSMTPLADDVEESGEAAVFLTAEQRERLIQKSPPALRAYLRGLDFTGARPSELAKATVADLDMVNGRLTLRHKKGRPPKIRPRAVTLSTDAIAFFTQQARSKLPTAPLVSNPAGGHWLLHPWCRAIREAITAANIKAKPKQIVPLNASAYSFRHARISELLQLYGVDPLTVAQQTGTSMAMMEKCYFKFLPDSLREKLNAVKA